MARREYSAHSGNHSGRMLDEAAKYISQGRVKMAVVAGGEALDSLAKYAKAGKRPPWTPAENIVTGKVGSVVLEETYHTRHGTQRANANVSCRNLTLPFHYFNFILIRFYDQKS